MKAIVTRLVPSIAYPLYHSTSLFTLSNKTMPEPKGTIAFATVGRADYGFDIFSVNLPSPLTNNLTELTERRLTDGTSINYNGQFVDEDETITYISERTGSARIFLNRPGNPEPELLPTATEESLFHDRPIIRNGRLFFVSTHELPDVPFKSCSAVYATQIDSQKTVRLTPYGTVDYSPSVSQTGKFVAVASYGSKQWKGDFHELDTDIVVFPNADPTQRKIVCEHGGWPTWSGDSTLFFHRKADDGWWSIFRVDLEDSVPRRITPSGVHAFTPTASHDGKYIAVATRRRGNEFRHIEIFDLESESFLKLTELINPSFHHYNPFFSTKSSFLGYHRFRGESAPGDSTIPHIEPVISPIKDLRLVRVNGAFPEFSADGGFIALNPDFIPEFAGLKIVRSDGAKKWTVVKDRLAFYCSWSKTEKGVIYTSVGPIFEAPRTPVQIARVSFNPTHLDDNHEEIPAEVKILTSEDSGNNAFPSCSPDGKHIVFRSGRSGNKNLYIIDAVNGETNGGAIRQLTDGPWIDTMPRWSPDGEIIAFSSNRHNPDDVACFSIYFIRPDGSDLRRVYVAGPEGSDAVNRERFNHVCFSPDCKWLLFAGNVFGVSAEPVSLPNHFQPYGDLYLCRVDGSELRRLTSNGYENGTSAWHECGVELGVASLSLGGKKVGDKLEGKFEEPLWISCDV